MITTHKSIVFVCLQKSLFVVRVDYSSACCQTSANFAYSFEHIYGGAVALSIIVMGPFCCFNGIAFSA